jgi:uncharacterized membrane protein
MVDSLAGMLCAGVMVLMVGGFLYATIVRARDWNYPRAARGIGIALLGLIVVGVAAVAESDGAGDWAWFLKAAGIAVAVVGGLWWLIGMGLDTR